MIVLVENISKSSSPTHKFQSFPITLINNSYLFSQGHIQYSFSTMRHYLTHNFNGTRIHSLEEA